MSKRGIIIGAGDRGDAVQAWVVLIGGCVNITTPLEQVGSCSGAWTSIFGPHTIGAGATSEALNHAGRILAIHVAGGSLDSSPRSRYHYIHKYRDSVRYQIRDGLVSELVSRLGSIHV